MSENHSKKVKLRIIIAFAVLFLVVSILLVLIFYAGKKTYTVTFDPNGGTVISGSLEQYVTQGQNATPPTVVKDGAYLHSWSASPNQVTKDMVITAVWNYETTKGIIFSASGNQNFAEIEGAYKYINGEVYIGSYHGDKKILGIKKSAFANCKGITKIYLLDGLLSIGDSSFENCTGLTEIEIPKTVTHIGAGAFRNCSSLEKVVLNEGLLEIGAGAFENCTSLKEIVIPSSVTHVYGAAFLGCESLEKITIGEGIEEIYPSTFVGCESLTELTIPSNVKRIGQRAFADCKGIKTLTLNQGLKEIREGAFEFCEALEETTLPLSVTTIEAGAFKGCNKLTIKTSVVYTERPSGWAQGWEGNATIWWFEDPDPDSNEPEEDDDILGDGDNVQEEEE